MKQQWTVAELEDFWMIHPEEFKLLHNKSGETRLSFVFMLKYFQLFSHFPNDKDAISPSVLSYLAKQVDVADIIFKTSHLTSRTGMIHRRQIREFLEFRPSTKSDIIPFTNWLVEKVLSEGKDSLPFLKEKSYMYFQHLKIEPFSPQYIERYIRSALTTFENNLFKKISNSLTDNNKKSLLNLLEVQEKQSSEIYYLRHLKQDSGNVSLESILEEGKKINCIQEIGLPKSLFSESSQRILEKYKTRIMSERPSEIRDHKDPRKYATLAMFCCVQGQELTDNLIDLLIQVVHKIWKKAEKKS